MLQFRKSHEPDYTLITLIFVILAFGLIMLSSASSVVSYRNFSQSYHYFIHQIKMGFLPGLLMFFVGYKIKYKNWSKIASIILGFALILMIAVFIPGIGATHGTARSWISIFGFSFQPSEALKLALIIYLAYFFSKEGIKVSSWEGGFAPVAILLGIFGVLLYFQPDLGTLMIISSIVLAIYFVAGADKWQFSVMIVIGGLLGFIGSQVSSYRMERFMAFLDPSKDPLGIGYHINQALIAVGSGGFFGVGLGQSRQKFSYLPEVYCDSIFAIVGEEMGFFVAVILVLAFVYLVVKAFNISRNAPDNFGKLTAFGIGFWFVFQAVVNISSMIGLMPMTGVPLTLISYGGSAMIMNLLAGGILVNISKYTKI